MSGRIVWECLCDCGNTAYIDTNSLTSGNTRSCGCFNKEVAAATAKVRGASLCRDLTGQRFGGLTVVRKTENRQTSHVIWECLCDCGTIVFVNSSNLVTGGTRSCGCMRKILRAQKTNEKEKSVNFVRGEDICVYCGAPVPEGRMICLNCEYGQNQGNGAE